MTTVYYDDGRAAKRRNRTNALAVHSSMHGAQSPGKQHQSISTTLALSLGLAVGLTIGFLLGAASACVGGAGSIFSPLAASNAAPSSSNNCKVCEEDQYWYIRKRVPFLGNLHGDWLEQYMNCLPMRMRYQYSMNGTIGISGAPPSNQGSPETVLPTTGGPDQKYAPLNTRSDLFGETHGSSIIWSKALLDFMISEIESGKDISCAAYPESALDVGWALKLLKVGMDDRLLVGGSISPWVEAVALHAGVGEVTTVDFQEPFCDGCHPRLRTMHMDTVMKKSTPAGYSIIVSYSSIEHDGLGRYGDPMDPYGDQHAMNEFWSLLKPDGILLLAIPLWPDDQITSLLARLYGPIRLPWLIRGWEFLGCINRGVWSNRVPLNQDWGWHPIIALRKTSHILDTDAHMNDYCTLNCAESQKNENGLLGFPACRGSTGCVDDMSYHWPGLAMYPPLVGLPAGIDARKLPRTSQAAAPK